MSWTTVALIAIGAIVLLSIVSMVVWALFARKMFRSHDEFFKDDDFFNRNR